MCARWRISGRHCVAAAGAPELLRRALDVAHRCGVEAVAERVRVELLATGARPRRLLLSGPEASRA